MPALAESWSNPDPLTWQFKLRQGVKFHNGEDFDANAVKFTPDGGRAPVTRAVAVECPVALEYNGIGYAVLMATPADLDDLATGFALSERLIDSAADIIDIDIHYANGGHQDVNTRFQINPGDCTRVIDLDGGSRNVDHIVFKYEENGRRHQTATVRVFAE